MGGWGGWVRGVGGGGVGAGWGGFSMGLAPTLLWLFSLEETKRHVRESIFPCLGTKGTMQVQAVGVGMG